MEIELPDGTVLDAPDDADPSAVAKAYLAKQKPSFLKELGSAAVRPIVQAVSALPLMAMDAGVAGRNLVTNLSRGQLPTLADFNPFATTGGTPMDYELPSRTFNRELDKVTLPPKGIGAAAEFVSSALIGSKIPAPQTANQVPAGVQNARQVMRNEMLSRAQKEGYVVPPSANNPTAWNRLREGIAGKVKLNQDAVIRNQPVTERLAATGVGQHPDSVLTPAALGVIRKEAHDAGYGPLRDLGEIATDSKFLDDLIGVTKVGKSASRSFPGLSPEGPVDNVIAALAQDKFDASDGIDAISHLRGLADEAYGAKNNALGKQYKTAAKAIEDMIERHLAKSGGDGAGLLKAFREARTRIAQTHTAAKALTDDLGGTNARAYAAELVKGKPLVGDQRKIGEFSASFGKYTPRPSGENFTPLGPLDLYGAAGVSAAADSAAPFAFPLTRLGLREYLLSQQGQKAALRAPFRPRETMGLLGALPVAEQELLGIFGQ